VIESLILGLILSCSAPSTEAINREAFEDEWWHSEKLDLCVCFINTNPERTGYSQQVLLYDLELARISMLSAWEFEDPNTYRVVPTGSDTAAGLVFTVNPDGECWDISLDSNSSPIHFREVMCDCSQREN
jgi:hypothetical protein